MWISKTEYVKPLINGLGLTAGKKYFVIDGGFNGNGAFIQDDDGITHYLSADFLLNNAECLYTYWIHYSPKKVKEVERIKIDKRLIDSYVVDSLFDFRGYTDDDKTALKRILSDIENAHILNWSMSRYAEKVYKQLETEV